MLPDFRSILSTVPHIHITCATSREMLIFFLRKVPVNSIKDFHFGTIGPDNTFFLLFFYINIYIHNVHMTRARARIRLSGSISEVNAGEVILKYVNVKAAV